MNKLLAIYFVFLSYAVAAQHSPAELALRLTANQPTDKQKITAIFQWITDNIAYKTPPPNFYGVIGKVSRRFIKGEETDVDMGDDGTPLKPLNDRVAETVIKRGSAVCDGYSRLFQSLCQHAGVRSVIIPGFARIMAHKPQTRFMVNHYWNAVYFDSAWHLLDVTWASGYISATTGEFVKEYDGKYFLSLPAIFAKDHFPDDPAWSLLTGIPVPDEFRHSPFKQKAFTKYPISSFYPAKGIIEASEGDTIHLRLYAATLANNISPDLLADSVTRENKESKILLQPVSIQKGNGNSETHYYRYTIATSQSHWLYLLYNDDKVLRYLVNVKKKKAG